MSVARCLPFPTMHRKASMRSFMLLAVMAMLVSVSLVCWSYTRYPYKLHTGFITAHQHRSRQNKLVWTEDPANEVLSLADKNTTIELYNVSRPLPAYGDFECIKTRTSPSVTVCLFDIWHDVFISRSLQSAGVWEPYVVDEFVEAVKWSDETAGVLDIGANIGYYSLIAARLGHKVVAVEPMLDSIKRIHRAAQIDRTAGSIQVVHNALAEIRTKATLRPNGDNQGDARIQLSVRECSGMCPQTINTILLDDLTTVVPFRQAVMKIDIQGSEHRVFQRASALFRTVHFTHIFMEWMVMRDFYVAANHTSHDKQLVNNMIRFLFRFNYRPYKLVYEGGAPLDPTDWGAWPLDVVWHRLPNADEKLRLDQNHYRNWPP